MSWVAVAIAGSAVIGAVASERAASKQAKGTKKAIASQERLLGPFTEAGTAGIPALQQFVTEGGDFSQTQAFKDITNLSKATGAFGSGRLPSALTEFFATNFRPQRLQELSTLPFLGANVARGQATNVGNLQTSLGATQAAGTLGIGTSAQQGLSSLAFLNLLNQNQPSFNTSTRIATG